ncbi:uncharacterized protein BDZ99DRAFT_468985 [Mytilinidion resinicola]|uniref:F-box domain-containing protein n=1 Tax=Mytilinidion resinicola TaxID=574789 RepID=A0A6A6Y435_9PEZI|nr:uncharacterized protein BDZ99DRAFT_468985 [Mytilinidion resinicola]KAF2802547.1 hypothetical protein BDZ99DRAFT_468985 [Mytilinidion resinicola]
MAKDPKFGMKLLLNMYFSYAAWKSYPKRKAATQHNEVESQFYRLPVEVLVLIGDELSPLSTLRIRQTCRKLRYIFPPDLGLYPLSEMDWEISSLERAPPPAPESSGNILPIEPIPLTYRNQPPIFRIWCSACTSRHPAYLFSVKQRSCPPLERLCLGTENKFRLCGHKSFTHKELELLITPGGEYTCKHEDHLVESDIVRGRYYPSISLPLTQLSSDGVTMIPEDYRSDSWLPITRIPVGTATSESMAKVQIALGELGKAGVEICPHIRPNDDSVLEAVKKAIVQETHRTDWSGTDSRAGSRDLLFYVINRTVNHRKLLCKTINCHCWVYIYKYRPLINEGWEWIVLHASKRWKRSTPIEEEWIGTVSSEWIGLNQYPGRRHLYWMRWEQNLNDDPIDGDWFKEQHELIFNQAMVDLKADCRAE